MYQIKWYEFFFDFYLSGEIQAISLGRFCSFKERLIQSFVIQTGFYESLIIYGSIDAFSVLKLIY